MKKIGLLFILIPLIFFYPLFKSYIPFPGDLLVGEYAPYNSYSFLGYAPAGYPNKAQDFDVLRLLYPAKEFSIQMLKNSQVPLWNPYNFSGNPHFASLQSGTFYPFNIFFIILPFNFAWSIYIISQPILTLFFTFLLLTELGLSKKSSIFGSFVFSFSSFQTVWMEYGNLGHSILWLPIAMWLSLRIIKKPRISTSIFLIFSLSFSIFAGYIQNSFYVYFFLFVFILFNIFRKKRSELLRNLIIFASIFIVSILLCAIQLLPTFELILNSSRSSYPLSSYLKLLIPSFHSVTLFVPDFFGNPASRNYWVNGTYIERVTYIGVLPLIFVLYALFKKPNRLILFFSITAVIIILLTFNTIFSRTFYTLVLPPLISTSVPTRIMFLFSFALSILSAYGVDSFLKEKPGKKMLKSIFSIGCIYFLFWIFIFLAPFIFKNQPWLVNLRISQRNLLLPSAIFFIGSSLLLFNLKFSKFKNIVFAAFFVLTIFDLFYFFQKITPFSPKESVYPKTEVLTYLKSIQGINRSWGYGSAYIDANIQTYEKIFSTNGYDALHIKRYGEFLTSSVDGKISSNISGADADIKGGYGEDDLRANEYRQRLLNLLGVKYLLNKGSAAKTFPKEIYRLIWQKGPWQIYENKASLPRFYLAQSYIVETDRQKIMDKIFNKNFDISNTLILEENLTGFSFKKDENKSVSMISFNPNNVVFKTKSREDNLLFFSDNYYPGWNVFVDGLKSRIYRADYSFRAVPLKKGEHEVVFSYYPRSFDLGLKISSLTFFSIIIFTAVLLVKLKKKNVFK